KLIEQSQLMHQLERRRMNGVAAKIAQEIAVLFQHQDWHVGARQQVPQHHACRAAAGDTAANGNFLRRHVRDAPALAYQKRWTKKIGCHTLRPTTENTLRSAYLWTRGAVQDPRLRRGPAVGDLGKEPRKCASRAQPAELRHWRSR